MALNREILIKAYVIQIKAGIKVIEDVPLSFREDVRIALAQ